ncbi:FadR/GntR family transcriptional regulator [Herbaspirillum autotrophicum]|uniref:FadR/GntR family transcriptional regulator n=1 Tax=Herbaspirillum autotrophicum TaxID=180195 RepID=UPI00067BB11C|nr:FadR/GntR family transcriptional regulator [Herbaspirillum autotrophicum]
MSSFHPVSVTRLYRMIADQIAGRIRAGDFQVGERLPSERELAEQLEVSRPSIREALIALEIEGYVEVRVGTGVFVTLPKKRDETLAGAELQVPYEDVGPFDLMATRLLVEPECAALAAGNASQQQLAAIVAAAASMPGSGNPRLHDRAFHLAIAEASGNVALSSTVLHLLNLRDSSAMLNRLEEHFVTHQVWQLAEVEHDRVLQAIRAGDAEGARQAMFLHLNGILDRLREDFGNDDAVMSGMRLVAGKAG